MKLVESPAAGIYRVGRNDRPVFSPPDVRNAGHGRFDAPVRSAAVASQTSFAVMYCCSSLLGALVETLQKFRPSLGIVAQLGPEADGSVPQEWAIRRSWNQTVIGTGAMFVDSASAETLASLRAQRHLAIIAEDLGLADIDLSALTGPHRRLTQAMSVHIRSVVPEAAGTRYM